MLKFFTLPEIHDFHSVADLLQKTYVRKLEQVMDDKVHHGLANWCNEIVL